MKTASRTAAPSVVADQQIGGAQRERSMPPESGMPMMIIAGPAEILDGGGKARLR